MIPIVFLGVSDPIGEGFIASLARPGANMTGILNFEASITGKWFAMLKEIDPRLERAAFVANPKTTPYDYFLQAAKAAASSLEIELVPSPVGDAADIERIIASFAAAPNGGLVLPPDITTLVHRDLIIALAARHRLPATTLSVTWSRPAVSCPTDPTCSMCFGRRPCMSIASCAAKTRRASGAGAGQIRNGSSI